MRYWISGAAVIAGIALIALVPRFTAARTESYRHRQLAAQTAGASLPACPVGEDLDVLLNRAQPDTRAVSLWIPACREQPSPMGRVLVIQTTRAGFRSCSDQLSRQSSAGCALDEPLKYLSGAQSRSVARVKIPDALGRPVIWTTSKELAWGDALIGLHRLYFILALFTLTFGGIFGYHARFTYGNLRILRTAAAAPPAWAEFWLLFVLPRYAQSLPLDYRDEYEERLKTEGAVPAAHWYRRNVYASLSDLMWMRIFQIFHPAKRAR